MTKEKNNIQYQNYTASKEKSIYDRRYFDWQKGIGEFGGIANLFKFENEISQPDTVLDFGCGGGYLLNNITCKRKMGIEINESAREEAQKNGVEAYESFNNLEDSYIDIIISNHALEHVTSPFETLKSLYPKLRSGGKIIFVVPHQDTNEEYDPNDPNNHLYTWNQQTLGNLFRHAGYKILKVEAIQHQWPPNYKEIFAKYGEEEFHKQCKEYAKKNNNYQIRIVAQKPRNQVLHSKNDTPVALIAYNRPKHTLQVLKALKDHDVKNLIIYSDAPKENEDPKNVLITRKIIADIDWVKPQVVYQDKNQGLARSITAAVEHCFENHDRMILLEDDCVPGKYFFDFMTNCLDKYEDNEKIFGISGYSVPIPPNLLASYPYDLYFHPRIGSWGWATWQSTWSKYEHDLQKLYDQCLRDNIDLAIGGSDIPTNLTKLLRGEISDVWTLNWVLTVYLNRGFFVYPTFSHIYNIGFDGTGVHCGKTDKFHTKLGNQRPGNFPEDVFLNIDIINHFNSFYGKELISKQSLNLYQNANQYKNIQKDELDKENKSPSETYIGHTKKNKPQIAQFCMQDFGGAGTAALRLHEGLVAEGANNTFYVQNIGKWREKTALLSQAHPPAKIEKFISPEWQAFEANNREILIKYPNRPPGSEMFSIPWAATKLESMPGLEKADIINLHWISGTLSVVDNIEFLKDKKIVWTLHDMNPFTGGCHYAGECRGYENYCGNCPQLGSNRENDLSREIWKIKKTAYRKLDIEIVALCSWMAECVKKSTLLSSFPVHIIPNRRLQTIKPQCH
jgi:SAM-dependent methyltransferase